MKLLSILTILLLFTLTFALSVQEVDHQYFIAQDKGTPSLLKATLNEYLKLNSQIPNNCEILWKIARNYIEYGLRVQDSKEKIDAFNDARKFGEQALKINNESAMAHYEVAVAIGRLAQYVGILKSLFNLPALDGNFKDAIRLDPNLARAYLGLGMRYRDTPWYVGGSFDKALDYINKAIQIDPKYINNYLELGYLYEKMGKKDKAKDAFNKVLSMQPYFPYHYQFGKAKASAKEEIEKLNK